MKIDDLLTLIKRRGFYFQAFNIYGEVGGFYDYGPIGVRIKNNLIALWRRTFVEQLGAYEVDTTTIMPEPVFKASGHLTSFTDPLVTCASCKTPHRADKLLEEFYSKKGDAQSIGKIEKMNNGELERELKANKIKCPTCGKSEFGKVETFNLLFKTAMGPTGAVPGYLRPETPQGIFVDFKHLFTVNSMKLPVAIAQTGKVYRNEISPRQQTIRMREFSQMDVEVFFDPEDEKSGLEGPGMKEVEEGEIPVLLKGSKEEEMVAIGDLLKKRVIPNRHFALLLYLENGFALALGFKKGNYRFRQVEVTPHYSRCNFDLEVKTSYDYIELSGLAYRTDYDLSSHAKQSGKDLSVTSDEKKVLPHVVELSIGVDRPLFAILDAVFEEGKDRGWSWLRLNESLAPYRYGVFPLQKDDKLVDKAKALYRKLVSMHVPVYYSEAGSIGKRYAKADEIGVPYCITIDYDTLTDDTVTIRNRDDAKQVRKSVSEVS
ncbi:MAG: glycine--tRNA ligase [Candidatus Micrarchaeales archaeon]|nr:glycine--tRNA ligase [Candidatus Micrarchaeales archaeon]